MLQFQIGLSVTSRGTPQPCKGLFEAFVQSFAGTVRECRGMSFHIYFGYDHDDPLYGQAKRREEILSDMRTAFAPLPVRVVPIRLEGLTHKILRIWNTLAEAGYRDGCDYYLWAGDDVKFLDPGWPRTIVRAMQGMPRPNFGATALFDLCQPGDYTFPVVHRTHLDIFDGRMFPPDFDELNQFGDPWTFLLYKPWESTALLHDARVINAVGTGQEGLVRGRTRYERTAVGEPRRSLLIDRGRDRIRQWAFRTGTQLPPPRPAARAAEELLGKTYIYERIGFDRRPVRFLSDRTIAGGAGCERWWKLAREDDVLQLGIHGDRGVTCKLTRGGVDRWQERWLIGERMPVLLRPAGRTAPPRTRRGPLVVCSICTRRAMAEFLLLKFSLERFHAVRWLLSCDAYAQRRLRRFRNVTVLRELALDDAPVRDDKIGSTFHTIMCEKTRLARAAISVCGYALYLDADQVFLRGMDGLLDKLRDHDAVAAPHYIPEHEQKLYGEFNAGMFLVADAGIVDQTDEIQRSGAHRELADQLALNDALAGRIIYRLPPEYNYAWWRVGHENLPPARPEGLFDLRMENGRICHQGTPVVNLHLHAFEEDPAADRNARNAVLLRQILDLLGRADADAECRDLLEFRSVLAWEARHDFFPPSPDPAHADHH